MLTQNERLTHEHANGWYSGAGKAAASKYWTNATKAQLMERLAAYEDTGLTPGEVRSMLEGIRHMRAQLEGET